MPADIVHEDNPVMVRIARKTTPPAALAALGIVYGDLGTSPLYTLKRGRRRRATGSRCSRDTAGVVSPCSAGSFWR